MRLEDRPQVDKFTMQSRNQELGVFNIFEEDKWVVIESILYWDYL